ncbi:MAG: GNAT family N-acetyltransferase [Candidatus Roizmanbacteria bacterium]|nr:GNAT family N-acetyltransferase [Candidatus Roizmanbacteria bacterium]
MRVKILKRKSQEMRLFDKNEWPRYNHEHFGKEITWDTQIYYVKVEENSSILGTMELKVEAGVGHIKTLLVKKEIHRKGVGQLLIQKAKEITRKQKGHKLYLTTGKSWKAVTFYEAMGFKISAVLPNHFFGVDFVEMTKFF